MKINLTIEAFVEGHKSELDQLNAILDKIEDMNGQSISLAIIDHKILKPKDETQ